jgi:hypothetical protein
MPCEGEAENQVVLVKNEYGDVEGTSRTSSSHWLVCADSLPIVACCKTLSRFTWRGTSTTDSAQSTPSLPPNPKSLASPRS